MITDNILEGIRRFAYSIGESFLKIGIEVEKIFQKFIDVDINSKNDIFHKLFGKNGISAIFYSLFAISIFIFFIECIISYTKSILSERTQNSGSKAIKKTFKGIILFTLLPTILFLIIVTLNTVGKEVNQTLKLNNKKDTIVKNIVLSGISEQTWIGDADFSNNDEKTVNEARKKVERTIDYGFFSYDSIENTNCVDMKKYEIGIMVSSAFCWGIGSIYILGIFIFKLINTIYLYLISPLIVSAIPLDESSGLKKWIDEFISSILMGYLILLIFNLLLRIFPYFLDLIEARGELKFFIHIMYCIILFSVPTIAKRLCAMFGINASLISGDYFRVGISYRSMRKKDKDQKKEKNRNSDFNIMQKRNSGVQLSIGKKSVQRYEQEFQNQNKIKNAERIIADAKGEGKHE